MYVLCGVFIPGSSTTKHDPRGVQVVVSKSTHHLHVKIMNVVSYAIHVKKGK